MPIPKPNAGENQEDFHGRCMSTIWEEYKDKENGPAQANAICYSAWREREKSIDTATGLVAYDLQGQRKKASMSYPTPKRLYGRIEKVEDVGDGTIKVHGIASTEDEDDQGEVVKADAMRAAIPDYMRFGAVREMHGLSAAGRALECNCGNDNFTRIVAHVVDPVAVKKVQNRVYNGFSIGGRVLERAAGDNRTITRLALHEISLVDRPANPQATIDLWKSGEVTMPDGLNVMEAAFAEAMAKVGQQIWPCGVAEHRHTKKEEAAKCIIEKAGSKPNVGDPQTGWDAVKARKPFPNAAPPFGREDGEADKVGLPGGPPIRPHGGTEKHGEPGQGITRPTGRAPGAPDAEENFDGDHDADDNERSADSSGGGYQPESDSERGEDFGKTKNGNGKPKGDYGDVTYADPGYRNNKPRYPLDNETHIRAAWSYINMPKNAGKYTSEQLSAIKSRIRAAMKRIGAEVAQKVANEADETEIADMVVKALAGAAMLDDLVIEKAGRRQSAADNFLMNVAHDTISKLTDMAFCAKAAANATQDTGGNAEHAAPDQGTDSGAEHYRLGENATQDTNKRGARHSAATMGYLRKAHDNLCRAGAACPAQEGMSKSSTTEDGAMGATTDDEGAAVAQALKKALKKNDKLEDKIAALTTQVSNMAVHMEYLAKGKEGPPPAPVPVPEKAGKVKKALEPITTQLATLVERVEQIAKQPMPGAASRLPPGIFDISKSQDGRNMPSALTPEQIAAKEEIQKYLEQLPPEHRERVQFNIDYATAKETPYTQRR